VLCERKRELYSTDLPSLASGEEFYETFLDEKRQIIETSTLLTIHNPPVDGIPSQLDSQNFDNLFNDLMNAEKKSVFVVISYNTIYNRKRSTKYLDSGTQKYPNDITFSFPKEVIDLNRDENLEYFQE
jgi:hypothetical protein